MHAQESKSKGFWSRSLWAIEMMDEAQLTRVLLGQNVRLLEESVSVSGPTDAPAIVLIHGLHLGRSSWAPHVQVLQKHFRCVTLDLPRHGSLIRFPLTQELVIELLLYVCDRVLCRQPLLVGYSLGGYVAMLFSSLYPERTRGLMLAGATLNVTSWRSKVYRQMVSVSDAIPDEILTAWSRLFFRLTLPSNLAASILQNKFDRRAFGETGTILNNVNFSSLLAAYEKPALLVNAEYDLIFRPQAATFSRGTNVESQIVRRSGHVFPLRKPVEFCETIAAFSATVDSKVCK